MIRGRPDASLRALRLRARLPRYLAVAMIALLSIAGLRAAIHGPPEAAPATPVSRGGDLAARGFAEAFARAYLSWDASRPEDYEPRLRAYMTDNTLEGGGAVLPDAGAETVGWTAAVAEEQLARSRAMVTVAAETESGLVYLAVPVSRDARGFLRVDTAPAIVGPPPVSHSGGPAPEREVEDERLVAIVDRALRNYLGRERQNLLADLAPDAVVSIPPEEIRVTSVEPPTWAVPGRRVAVRVEGERPNGLRLVLRYELEVVRRDRWYVRSLGTDAVNKGGSP